MAPLEKATNITLTALTNDEKVDEIPEIASITQPSQQDESNAENKIKEANLIEKECDEPKICSNLTNSVHLPTPQEVKIETKVNEQDTSIANNDIENTILANTQSIEKEHLDLEEPEKKVDENERNKKYNDDNLTVENSIITNEVKIENQKSDVQSSNLVPNLLETSASEFSLLKSEKEINLIESPKDIPVPNKNKNSNAPTLSSSNLLDCSLPKQETLNLEMDKEAPRGKCPYHLSLINLINLFDLYFRIKTTQN